MRVSGKLAIISSSLLLAACAYHRPPVVYTTPTGQVVAAGPDARTAADRALETSVRAELDRYGDLARANPGLQFYAHNGTITLTGPVRTERERQMIETMARQTPGVVSVNDQLQVVYPPTGASTPAPVYTPPVVTTPPVVPQIDAAKVADQPLARRIGDQLQSEGVPADWLRDVRIQVSNGAAYVQGYVATQQQREAIDTAIQHVSGVTAVYDQLQLR